MQLLGTSRRWARVAAPQPGKRRPSELHFSLRPVRPYLPCARGSAQKLKTRRQYAPTRLRDAPRLACRTSPAPGKRHFPGESLTIALGARRRHLRKPHSPPLMFATCGLPGYALGRARPKASPTAVKATAKSKVTPTSVPMRKRSSSVIEGEVNAAVTASFVQYAGEKSAAV